MNRLIVKEIYIRLTDDKAAFVCTVKCGKLYSKETEFALECQPMKEHLDEKTPALVRMRSSRRSKLNQQ